MVAAVAALSVVAVVLAGALFAGAKKRAELGQHAAELDAKNRELQGRVQSLSENVGLIDAERTSAVNRLMQQVSELETKNQQLSYLSRYSGLLDIEAKAASILDEAKRAAAAVISDATREATNHVAKARVEAEALLAQAREHEDRARAAANDTRAAAKIEADELKAKAAAARDRVEERLAGAHAEAARIVEAARKRAEEIAGDAYTALEKKEQFEETARAMKNVIEGYGDQYLIPTFGLLDELADEFGYDDAAKKYAAARDSARQMVKTGTAADCDYVEENRRKYAIEFALLAFNGAVEDVFASVRHDNFGTLERKLRDAYTLVNFNGQAFRKARIQPGYLETWIEALRWACVVQELKLKEREEQRAIKEKIREEERAQREFERAMKDAQKEEELLKKAMAKVQAEVAKAGDAQKAKYEQQLAELTARLHEAEEKNQRALSMAQQTRSGFVYVISNIGSFGEDVFKIGLTRRLEPLDRIRELGDASVPFDFDVHAMIRSEDAPALERELHKKFVFAQMNKVNPRKEFFRVRLHDIRAEVEKLGIPASWTMAALAKDYRESQALERELQTKAVSAAEWAEKQVRAHDAAEAFSEADKADAA